jgi:putative transposase
MHRRAHAHHLRKGRATEANRIYLITIVCAQRKTIFADIHCGRTVVRELQRIEDNAKTLCFVIMPDHIHWLMQLDNDLELSRCAQKFKGNVTRELHKRQLVNGKIWEPSFHDSAIRRERDLLATARYIVANPLRAGLVNTLRDYPLWDAVWL